MSAFVKTLGCHLYSAKPISKSMLICCQLGPWKQIPIIFRMFNFPLKRMVSYMPIAEYKTVESPLLTQWRQRSPALSDHRGRLLGVGNFVPGLYLHGMYTKHWTERSCHCDDPTTNGGTAGCHSPTGDAIFVTPSFRVLLSDLII